MIINTTARLAGSTALKGWSVTISMWDYGNSVALKRGDFTIFVLDHSFIVMRDDEVLSESVPSIDEALALCK